MNRYIILIVFLLTQANLHAASPEIKKYRSRSDFEKGESHGISITADGKLMLSPALSIVSETNEEAVWDIVASPSGTIFFSAGSEGKIYQASSDKKATLFTTLNEIQVHALALDRTGHLYAASSPDGKVYKISSNGNTTLFFDPPDYYIWDLAFDSKNNLFVAAGDSGVIYRVQPNGSSSLFYTTDDKHVRTLAIDSNGNVIAGTSGKGYIYKISPSGDAFVIYDADLEEIEKIQVSPSGIIYAAALSERKMMPQPEQRQDSKESDESEQSNSPQVMDNGTIIIGEITIEAPRPAASVGAASHTAIFKIQPNGIVRNIWDFYNEPVQTIALCKDGTLLVGTGSSGKLVRISSDDKKTILLNVDESQITSFSTLENGKILVGTANMAKIYRLESQLNREGSYLSPVFDSYIQSKWGTLRWSTENSSKGDIKFFTRTGNTEEPGRTWSEWSSAYSSHEGEPIESPESRFIQWRLDIGSGDSKTSVVAKEVDLSYLQINLPPQIMDITLYPQGEYIQNNSGDRSGMSDEIVLSSGVSKQNSNQRSKYYSNKLRRKGYRSVSWQAIDDNDDELKYHLYYRGMNEVHWRTLARDLHTSKYAWDTERLPDGTYYLKIIATDSLSNPHHLAYSDFKKSEPFDIDNSGPVVDKIKTRLSGTKLTISFTVSDLYNIVDEVTYALDGEDWKTIYPEDSINDSKTERFNIETEIKKTGGAHSIVIKALDSVDNIGFGKSHFKE
ncbi:MAG: hypothetical protein V2J62_11900 [candidate division KSB1 bacterium]|jgi:hypothetical protein|nr:hypothetical protein [candidate division KSB1 bacterium]